MNILRMIVTMGGLIVLGPVLLYAIASDKLKRKRTPSEGPDISSLRFYEERDPDDRERKA